MNCDPNSALWELWLTASAFGSGLAFAVAATLVEAINAPGGVNDALFAGVKRMAIGAQIETHLGHGRVGGDFGSAGGASDVALHVIGVDFWFHVVFLDVQGGEGF